MAIYRKELVLNAKNYFTIKKMMKNLHQGLYIHSAILYWFNKTIRKPKVMKALYHSFY